MLAVAAWAAAVVLLCRVVVAGPFSAAGLAFDELTAVLAVLVTGVSALVVAFSVRYLQDDPRLGRFLALVGVTTGGTVLVATAASLVLLVAGWLVASAGFCLLLAHRRDVAGGDEALRRTAGTFALGDLALVAAAGLVLAAAGDPDLRAAGDARAAVADAGVATPAAVLLVVAALARCAQVPLHRWLPATVAAPTPVSALLHAGVVNAGGILLIRLAPVTGLPPAALALLLAAGAASVVAGTVAMLARPDVKGALAHSTAAQMGFMLVQVALGAAAAAVVHLVGHALYKSALFLGSGSAVAARRRREAAPGAAPAADAGAAGAPVPAGVRAAAALGLPAAALAGAVALAGGPSALGGAEVAVLLAFAWASGAHATEGWLRSGPPRALALAAGAVGAAALAYVGLLAAAKAFLADALPVLPTADPLLAAPIVAAVVAATLVRVAGPALGAGAATAYAWALDLAAPGAPPWPAPPRRRRPGPVPALRPAARVAS